MSLQTRKEKEMPETLRKATLWAHFHEQRGWCHASRNKKVSELLWEGNDVIQIEAHEDVEGEYWAWWENKDQSFNYLNRNIHMVQICFPYGPEAEQVRGRGELLRVSVIVQVPEKEEAV